MLYTILLYLIQLLVQLWLLLRSRKASAYRKRWTERYGFCQSKVEPDGILLYSVSVGEILAAVPLVRALRHHYPSMPITTTAMTPTGFKCAMSAFDKDAHHVYLPYDLPGAVNRLLNAAQPKLVIVTETELWPSMVTALRKRKVPLVIANTRLSERSVKGYARLGGLIRRLLSRTTLIAVQNEKDGNRFLALGLKRSQLAVTGSLKPDISVTPELTARAIALRRQWAPHRKVRVVTSTYDDEKRIILQTYKKLLETFPNLLLILVPRHLGRFLDARETVQKVGMSFTLRSTDEIPSSSTQVVIGDTMGELMLLYGITDLAFIGDNLVERGGHNLLEPTAHAIPVLVGPHTSNFKDIYAKLQQDDDLVTVTDADLLVREAPTFLTDKDYHLWYGRHAVEVLHQSRGTLSHLPKLLQPYMSRRGH